VSSDAILVTDRDRRHLQKLIAVLRPYAYGNLSEIESLQRELLRATVVPAHDAPTDLVTMNSQVVVCIPDTEQEEDLTLVFPALAEPACGRVSVLSPAGAALLGSRTGDVVEWTDGTELRRYRIQEITPPLARQAAVAVA